MWLDHLSGHANALQESVPPELEKLMAQAQELVNDKIRRLEQLRKSNALLEQKMTVAHERMNDYVNAMDTTFAADESAFGFVEVAQAGPSDESQQQD